MIFSLEINGTLPDIEMGTLTTTLGDEIAVVGPAIGKFMVEVLVSNMDYIDMSTTCQTSGTQVKAELNFNGTQAVRN